MSTILENNLKNREKLIDGIREEIIGPVLDFENAQELSETTNITEKNNGFYFWRFAGKKEEVFLGFKPSKKYAAGMLYPLSNELGEFEEEAGLINPKESKKSDNRKLEPEDRDELGKPVETSQRQSYIPSNLGITFAVAEDVKTVKIVFNGGIYNELNINSEIQIAHKSRFWFRKSVNFALDLDVEKEGHYKNKNVKLKTLDDDIYEKITLRLDVITRRKRLKDNNDVVKIITVTITNVTEPANINDDENLVFQSEINVKCDKGFVPYPNASQLDANIPDEDKRFDMLYKNELNYAFGQNCSATWDQTSKNVEEISSTYIPSYEIKTMTPDIEIINNSGKKEKVEISHIQIASCTTQEQFVQLFQPLLIGYEQWYESLKLEKVPRYYKSVFNQNLQEIEKAINRIRTGINIISQNKDVFYAFRLTNLAMLMQMVNGKKVRKLLSDDKSLQFESPYMNYFNDIDFTNLNSVTESLNKIGKEDKGLLTSYKWRGFQIAFMLMTVESIYDKKSLSREEVDLIWFPTGGGKTEAYLGLAAFSMIYRRIVNPDDVGVDVIMRYTLRLLTADQFQRAARLMCSLEYIRSHIPTLLGTEIYSIGLWVGQESTPNRNTGKNGANSRLNEYIEKKTPNFPIESCPWCGAEMTTGSNEIYHGYDFVENRLKVFCPDQNCHFNDNLPICFVDEELYKIKPTFLIGTIDKFVQLTWQPDARAIFGIDNDGNRVNSPPNLIIQDELHLISGPLGTLSGIYEVLIEWLCTDNRNGEKILPKIVCATATIKSYREQIHSLFGRGEDKANLFPPAGLDINDNYFSKILTIEKNGEEVPAPGRKYIGIYAFTQGRLQTEVQVNSALLSKLTEFPLDEDQRDPFWTILAFYNTINDIGRALSLTEQDIPNTLENFYHSRNIKNPRYIRQESVKELTSRMPSDDVSNALSVIAESYRIKNNKALDMVLASNIIEVGVDIDRLSLMVINGQPKTTAQYIQVSGRIGRKPTERPGLVVTIYNPTSSNDKSHYEHFNEYHQKLYGQVEESSVTPFSGYSIKRGLPAIIIGFIRQCFEKNTLGEIPIAEHLENVLPEIEEFIRYVIQRAKNIDDTEMELLRATARELLTDLMDNSYDSWRYNVNKKESFGFMTPMTQDKDDVPENVSTIMFSMRSVDAISRLKVARIHTYRDKSNDESGEKSNVGRFNF